MTSVKKIVELFAGSTITFETKSKHNTVDSWEKFLVFLPLKAFFVPGWIVHDNRRRNLQNLNLETFSMWLESPVDDERFVLWIALWIE
jgi:hypothetical protein